MKSGLYVCVCVCVCGWVGGWVGVGGCVCACVRACVCAGWGGGGPKTRWTGARKKKYKWGEETLILITQQVST